MKHDKLIGKCQRLGPWFHQIDIGDQVLTRSVSAAPGPQPLDHPMSRWLKIKNVLPADMSGMAVLDVGCSDGFFSVELAKRNAHSVLSIDGQQSAIKRLSWVKRHLKLNNITALTRDIYKFDNGITGLDSLMIFMHRCIGFVRRKLWQEKTNESTFIARRFDMVIMFALLYHLKAPLLALEYVAPLSDILLIETLVVDDDKNAYFKYVAPMQGVTTEPKLFPSTRCLKDMLKWVGYEHVIEIADASDKRPIYLAYKKGADLSGWKLPR
jgi:SAM-dependent methyltransferase